MFPTACRLAMSIISFASSAWRLRGVDALVNQSARREHAHFAHIGIAKPAAQFQNGPDPLQVHVAALGRNAAGGGHDYLQMGTEN